MVSPSFVAVSLAPRPPPHPNSLPPPPPCPLVPRRLLSSFPAPRCAQHHPFRSLALVPSAITTFTTAEKAKYRAVLAKHFPIATYWGIFAGLALVPVVGKRSFGRQPGCKRCRSSRSCAGPKPAQTRIIMCVSLKARRTRGQVAIAACCCSCNAAVTLSSIWPPSHETCRNYPSQCTRCTLEQVPGVVSY